MKDIDDNTITYDSFASVYDMFMDNIPYDTWTDYVIELLSEFNITNGLICELGCGTGNITARLAKKGFEMIGIDNSYEMLEIAREKEIESLWSEEELDLDSDNASRILYLEQDMRKFELYGTVSAIISLCDSMNYITTEKDLLKVFQLVNNYLDPRGIFIFDMKTEHYYRDVLGDTTIAENREEASFIWENTYNKDTRINEYELTIYQQIKEQKRKDRLFKRSEEIHIQRAYPLCVLKEILKEAGMEFVAAYDALTKNPVTQESERMYLIAREKHQENKYYIS